MKEVMIHAKVTTVYPENGTARVYREDKETVSGELIILNRGDNWTPNVGDHVVCLFYSTGSKGIILGKA